jgi:hypothetical protein
VEFFVRLSNVIWAPNNLANTWKLDQLLAHEWGHDDIDQQWCDEVVADAKTMEGYSYCSQDECERKVWLFEWAWKKKREYRHLLWN